MISFLIFLFGILVTLGMCVLAGKSDYKGFTIPNSISLVIIGCFVVTYGVLTLTHQSDIVFSPLGHHIGAALLVLMITAALFAFKKLGAGDSKFATALSLWIGLGGLIPFLFFMSLAGGVIAAFTLYLQKKKPFKTCAEGGWVDVAQKGGGHIPYGIAIGFGALMAFLNVGYFDVSNWESFF
jgi:prepilin peptidase CpaA